VVASTVHKTYKVQSAMNIYSECIASTHQGNQGEQVIPSETPKSHKLKPCKETEHKNPNTDAIFHP